jgi:hypothetical protein
MIVDGDRELIVGVDLEPPRHEQIEPRFEWASRQGA